MVASVYLTIDDSPSATTDRLTGFLKENNIPALLFCRGDFLEENPGPVIRAIQNGFIIGNHGYSHNPAISLGVEGVMEEIERTEALIESAYIEAGKTRPGYYFRFPYIDRGDGDRLERRFEEITDAVERGSVINLHSEPSGRADVEILQDYLHGTGFCQPFERVNHPLYSNMKIAGAADCLFTFSSCDWMLTPRHKGKWLYASPEDLEVRMANDPWLMKNGNAGIVLFHDQSEIIDETIQMISYMKSCNVNFMDYKHQSGLVK
jgi:peptidoglycan/xylan/chitin deacetylase (PgdA/CDA1 family)